MKKKLACIVGTRPQFIKYAVLRPVLASHFNVCLLHTGQHNNTSLNKRIFEDLHIPPPNEQLVIPEGVNSFNRCSFMQKGLTRGLEIHMPQAVILFGDTDSTLAGALAAEQTGIPSVHIEAGERSYNIQMPEENNRVSTDRLSRLLCCASYSALGHLNGEGMGHKAYYTGDLMKDLLLKVEATLTKAPVTGDYYFASIHRNYTRANASMLKKLLNELNSLKRIVFFSLHPSTRKTVEAAGISLHDYPSIRFLNPLSYTESIQYQKFSKAVITDSGGMQKEAYWLKKPCITLRTETEWSDTLIHGHNQLYYGEGGLISLLEENNAAFDLSLYGDGKAAYCITQRLETAV